jgi:hypothetical protein
VIPVIAGIDAGEPDTDFDDNGQVDFFDMLGFLEAFDEGCD